MGMHSHNGKLLSNDSKSIKTVLLEYMCYVKLKSLLFAISYHPTHHRL